MIKPSVGRVKRITDAVNNDSNQPVKMTERGNAFLIAKGMAFRMLWKGKIKRGLTREERVVLSKMVIEWEKRQ